ncbi:hypothetical protein TWF718_006702 [Orbilia javanica]|uniref:Uncharacterized protein n=1 Tax=Orbilia javanica TaxID=47235 RepID=A0AAN8MS79_9PEZI
MPTRSPNSPYFLRSFQKLPTAASLSEPKPPEYIGRPDLSLDFSGGIKSTCQICLTPKRGVWRKEIGKSVCLECLDDNVVRADVVQKIPNIDLTKLPGFQAMFYLAGVPNSKIHISKRSMSNCYWLPSVKKEASKAYNLPWAEIPQKYPELNDIRPLASPREIRDYKDKVREKIITMVVDRFHQELGTLFTGILTPDAFCAMLNSEQSGREINVVVPAEGQTDQANAAWVGARVEDVYILYFGPLYSTFPQPYIRYYTKGRLWGVISRTLLHRLTSGGIYRGTCELCATSRIKRYDLGATEFLVHVAQYHPAKLLSLDKTWKP